MKVVDLYLIYEFLKRLTTPFNETEAFRLGLIDKDGNRLKKPKTQEEKDALTYFNRLIFNLKRLLGMIPGGKSKIASYAAAVLLLREGEELDPDDEEQLIEKLQESIANFTVEEYNYLCEEAPANACAGASVGPNDMGKYVGLVSRSRGRRKKYGIPVGRKITGRPVGRPKRVR